MTGSTGDLPGRPAVGTANGEPLLKVRDLRTSVETASGPVTLVRDVNFDLHRGVALGIVGESGSGKTMLSRSIIGLAGLQQRLRVDGTVDFDGTDLLSLSRREMRAIWGAEIGVVFQDSMTALNPTVKIGRHLTEVMRVHLGLARSDANERAVELLRAVGIPEPERRVHQFPHELSGGMRQRVVIAIAIACGPKLMVADEPTTALDVTVQRQILDLLSARQQQDHMAMILITHDFGVVAERAHEVAVMYGASVVEQGSTREILERPRHPYTAALLRSLPKLGPVRQRLEAIPGRAVNLAALGVGCSFAPRCRHAQAQCSMETPALTADAGGHRVACFFPMTEEETRTADPVPSVAIDGPRDRTERALT